MPRRTSSCGVLWKTKLLYSGRNRSRPSALLEKQERRINELDAIIQRIYEDHVMGKLSAERFAKGYQDKGYSGRIRAGQNSRSF